ncbi:aspartate/glutamate racemase family protein [Paenisporosarcina sp. OV554]|uniref:aspartate/glutamate racemase family protein n=1 Tax=Paenisporosarcina sp. OV554 TaxID=2135694 RepID=UPI000D3B3C7E|nr:amino acid racemase [Paenisporosarcina sp. OV554]PUB08398.1 aspartate racemase [Paenisporosarcina sp. OV554]
MNKKVLGIIGGVGPLATMLLGEMIVKRTKAQTDQQHVNMAITNNTSIPDRTTYILDRSKANPVPVMISDAAKLRSIGAEVLAIPCNTAHSFYQEIQEGADMHVLHMINETAKRAAQTGSKKVGILATTGTLTTSVYQLACQHAGVQPIVPDEETQEMVMSVIYDDVKAGRPVDFLKWQQIINKFDELGCDRIILGCTELSIVKKELNLDDMYIDSMMVLAESAILACGYELKD